MGRNFAALFFLAYAFLLTLLSRKKLLAKMLRRAPEKLRRATAGAVNFFFLSKVKKGLGLSSYRLHFFNTAAIFTLLGLHLAFGWFSTFAILLTLLDTVALLAAALEISLLTVRDNLAQFGRPFVLYAPDPDPTSRRAFISAVIDGIFCALIPLIMAVANFVL